MRTWAHTVWAFPRFRPRRWYSWLREVAIRPHPCAPWPGSRCALLRYRRRPGTNKRSLARWALP